MDSAPCRGDSEVSEEELGRVPGGQNAWLVVILDQASSEFTLGYSPSSDPKFNSFAVLVNLRRQLVCWFAGPEF